MFIGAAMIAWLAVTAPKKRARIIRIIDIVLGSQTLAENVVAIRRGTPAERIENSLGEASTWWNTFRPTITDTAQMFADE